MIEAKIKRTAKNTSRRPAWTGSAQNAKNILEITPEKRTLYTMPPQVYDIIKSALERRVTKSVERALALLPGEWRKTVTIRVLPKRDDNMRGIRATFVVIDEVAELTASEMAALFAPNAPAEPSRNEDARKTK
jgi:hypothetical protein